MGGRFCAPGPSPLSRLPCRVARGSLTTWFSGVTAPERRGGAAWVDPPWRTRPVSLRQAERGSAGNESPQGPLGRPVHSPTQARLRRSGPQSRKGFPWAPPRVLSSTLGGVRWARRLSPTKRDISFLFRSLIDYRTGRPLPFRSRGPRRVEPLRVREGPSLAPRQDPRRRAPLSSLPPRRETPQAGSQEAWGRRTPCAPFKSLSLPVLPLGPTATRLTEETRVGARFCSGHPPTAPRSGGVRRPPGPWTSALPGEGRGGTYRRIPFRQR